MSCILYIETSTDPCSVAVSDDGTIIYEECVREPHQQTTRLAPMVRDAASFADSHAIPLDAVAISMGPGSYTGLRIGASTAKGLCYGQHLPLIGVPTLKLLCVEPLLHMELPEDALLCPMIDARRMEVYAAIYDRALREVRTSQADIVDGDTYRAYLDAHPVYFIGTAAEKCKAVITHPNAHFLSDIIPQAKYMYPLAEQARVKGEYMDIAYYEPYYLKDFVAGTPKSPLQALSHRLKQ